MNIQDMWEASIKETTKFKTGRSISFHFSSVTQTCSSFLRSHGLQHTRPSCPSPTPRVYPNSVYWVDDAIQPSHSLSSSSSPAFNLSWHQGLFKWGSSHQVAKALAFQLQHQSFQWTPRTDLLLDGLFGSSCSPRDYQEYSPTPQFKSISSSALKLSL